MSEVPLYGSQEEALSHDRGTPVQELLASKDMNCLQGGPIPEDSY